MEAYSQSAHASLAIDSFAADVVEWGGYVYTGELRSSRLANDRITEATLELCDAADKRLIDIGCGDGTYTMEMERRLKPALIIGLDPTMTAVMVARKRAAEAGAANVHISTGNAYQLPHADQSFDVAILRGVLHHLEDPRRALAEALRVARTVVAIEPNGYNPGLKLLERVSRYHREHGERSFMPRTLDSWVKDLGGRVTARRLLGFVPMFCPDWYATTAKRVEPLVEHTAGLRVFGCAQYAFAATSAPADG